MTRHIAIFLALFLPFLSSAQGLNFGSVSTPSWTDTPVTLSKGRKAVKTSTDVLFVAMPAATLAGVLIAGDWEGLKQGALTALATAGTTYLLKAVVHERRPDHTTFDSFPSGHTACAFATSGFLMRRYGWKFGVPAYVLSTYVAWGRVFARRHYVWDVVAGAAIGSAAAYIFTTPWARKHDFALAPAASETQLGFVATLSF